MYCGALCFRGSAFWCAGNWPGGARQTQTSCRSTDRIGGRAHVAIWIFSMWRRSHPHPVFNADGSRLYINVISDPWTQLCVPEVRGTP